MSAPAPTTPLPTPVARGIAAVLAWYREPRLTGWLVAGLAVLLALRKPDALLTPQLWAEDGSVFLIEQDQLGAAALLSPYMGYLHTIPRFTAWLAAHLLDPAWWPAFYNGCAFAIWLAVIARTFSPRLPLPHKPWLVLAFLLGPQTGEILFNITNAQWITAFVLVQQAIIARPVGWRQRTGDLVLLALVGFTGPFVVALVPLLAWRLWCDRHRDNVFALAVATVAALTQAWLILRANITFEHQHAALQLFNSLAVISRRLLIWPVLGERAAHDFAAGVIAAAGTSFGVALAIWVLRPHPLRRVRAQLLAAFVLLLAAGFVRMRPDTWNADDLAFSDRYFFLPRVLLFWLIILEVDAAPKAIAWIARTLALLTAFMHLPQFTLPAPPNYRWADHCDPIRQGVPARIPILPEGWILDYPGRPAETPARRVPGSHSPN